MIQDTLKKIEHRLAAETMPAEKRTELLDLLATLRCEVEQLSSTDVERAQSIAGFTQVSAHEAIRTDKNPALQRHAIAGLRASVEGFEETHPRLVQAVNSVCTSLSNLGI